MRCEQFREDVEALLSGELDEQTAREAREHAGSCAMCAEVLRSAEGLADALKAQCVLPMPAAVERGIRIRRGEVGGRVRRPVGALRRRVWAFAGVLVPVFVIGGLLLMRQQPVTASEIIARAEAASRRHHSWHLVSEATRSGKTTYKYEVWYRAPDSTKLLSSAPYWYTIHNGVRTECYHPLGITLLWPITRKEKKCLSERTCTVSLDTVDQAFKDLRDPQVRGTTEVRGRLCDVIEGVSVIGGSTERLTYAIDRETGLVMKQQVFHKGKLFQEVQTKRWEFDIPIADSVFESKPGPGTTVVKGDVDKAAAHRSYLKPASAAQAQVNSLLSQPPSRRFALNTVYWLSDVPSGYLLGECYASALDKSNRVLGVKTDYVLPDTWDTLVFMQTSEVINEGGQPVRSGDFVGRAVEGTEPYPYVRLTWTAGGAYYMITASSLPLDEVVKIAKSVKPSSEAPNPIAARPAVLEFYWLKDIASAQNPKGKWALNPPAGKGGNYVFRSSTEVSIDSIKQPKEVMDKVVQPKRNPPILTSRDLLPNATAESSSRGQAVVNIQFYARSARILEDFTGRHVGAVLAVFSDGRLLTAPTVREATKSGNFEITGFSTLAEAQRLADRINGSASAAK